MWRGKKKKEGMWDNRKVRNEARQMGEKTEKMIHDLKSQENEDHNESD